MNEKIKILFVPSDRQGVGHFRSIWPAQELQKNFSDEFDVEINHSPDVNNIDYLSKFHIIHFHRHLGDYQIQDDLANKLKERGIKMVMDIDDYWVPPDTHPMYEAVKKENLSEKIENNLKISDHITTTTNTFKEYIEKFNKNVHVIQNAVNTDHKMWKSKAKEKQTDKCRVGWAGGSSHYYDLELLQDSLKRLHKQESLKNKYQMVLCGFDTRGNVTEIDKEGNKKTRPIQPHESIWVKFEEIFTDNYRLLKDDPNYVNWLKKIQKGEYEDQYKKNYIRRWTLPLTKYAKHYDYCDICLAPLKKEFTHTTDSGQKLRKEHIFNKVKSELKIIEAGIKKKALIAQDFGIYNELLKDKNGDLAILIENDKKGWFQAIRDLIENKDERERMAENLHEFAMENYDISKVTQKRANIYKEILES